MKKNIGMAMARVCVIVLLFSAIDSQFNTNDPLFVAVYGLKSAEMMVIEATAMSIIPNKTPAVERSYLMRLRPDEEGYALYRKKDPRPFIYSALARWYYSSAARQACLEMYTSIGNEMLLGVCWQTAEDRWLKDLSEEDLKMYARGVNKLYLNLAYADNKSTPVHTLAQRLEEQKRAFHDSFRQLEEARARYIRALMLIPLVLMSIALWISIWQVAGLCPRGERGSRLLWRLKAFFTGQCRDASEPLPADSILRPPPPPSPEEIAIEKMAAELGILERVKHLLQKKNFADARGLIKKVEQRKKEEEFLLAEQRRLRERLDKTIAEAKKYGVEDTVGTFLAGEIPDFIGARRVIDRAKREAAHEERERQAAIEAVAMEEARLIRRKADLRARAAALGYKMSVDIDMLLQANDVEGAEQIIEPEERARARHLKVNELALRMERLAWRLADDLTDEEKGILLELERLLGELRTAVTERSFRIAVNALEAMLEHAEKRRPPRRDSCPVCRVGGHDNSHDGDGRKLANGNGMD